MEEAALLVGGSLGLSRLTLGLGAVLTGPVCWWVVAVGQLQAQTLASVNPSSIPSSRWADAGARPEAGVEGRGAPDGRVVGVRLGEYIERYVPRRAGAGVEGR